MFTFRLSSYCLIGLFAALLGYQSLAIEGTAKTYPLVLVMLVLAGALGNAVTLALNRTAVQQPPGDVKHLMSASSRERGRVIGFSLIWVVYTILLPWLGFIISTVLAISASLWMLKFRHLLAGVAGAVLFAFALSLLFTTVFYIPVPEGPVDAWLTELLYRLRG